MIELVAAADGAVGGEQRLTGQRQVADRIEHLVAHEFVGVTQAVRIEHAVLGHHQRIVERGAERIAGAPQLGDVLHEAEGARTRDLAAEIFRLDIERERLMADQRMVEVDLGLDAEAVLVGTQLAEGVAAADAHRLDHLDIAARQRTRGEAGLVDGVDEGSSAAVHDRHFRPVDLDDHVVDIEPAKRGQEMLGGGAERAG